ncbi:uncharacterized protein ColSpa_09061 [Colletotrichum spaethianum]|uniref:Uncharacterized protein n=1 Tax=Colletotrichum spaethianum TaxID=700344 RepID=A0AA37PB06_9PEZI|nr:uncharacterized protein ColSpa_09061 [Colletotrichum spaethianum]GKT48880.1 hypothetical protein ColSpa_09061 [Colletotrichum spaethianum]
MPAMLDRMASSAPYGMKGMQQPNRIPKTRLALSQAQLDANLSIVRSPTAGSFAESFDPRRRREPIAGKHTSDSPSTVYVPHVSQPAKGKIPASLVSRETQ